MNNQALQILLVEDNEAHAELVMRSFENWQKDYHIETVQSLAQARTFLTTSNPDLMLVDYLLPDGKGIELLPGKMNETTYPIILMKTPAILMTSHGNEQLVIDAMKAGALDYIIKSEAAFENLPYTIERILREWHHIVARRKAEKELQEKDQALQKTNTALELRVQERTMELIKTNKTLMAEISVRKKSEQRTQRLLQTQTIINNLLQSVSEINSIDELLAIALQHIVSGVWFSNLNRGAIFLKNENSGQFILRAKTSVTDPCSPICDYISPGQCLCGVVLDTGTTVFADSVGIRHTIQHEDMQPHSHYCVPIHSGNHLLGVLNILLMAGHVRDNEEEECLNTITNTLSGIIERYKTKEHLKLLNERYRLLLETTKFVPWELDLASMKFTYIGPQVEKMLGYITSEWESYHFWVTTLHPEDKDNTIRARQIATVNGEDHDLEYRMIDKHGKARWIRDIVTVVSDATGIHGLRGIFIDITDSKQQEEMLHQAKQQAEQANKAKSLFLARMSHEIRTPINAILGMGEMIAESRLDDDQRHYIQIINHAGEGLLALISDILDLSKIEADQLQLETIPFDPKQLATHAVAILKSQALIQGIIITTDFDNAIPAQVIGDPQRVQQILLNLLSNAVKFTEKGKITLSVVQKKGSSLRFSVADTGIGIAEERLTTVFQPFTQADTSTTRRFGGTGLGLSICQRLVEKMNGHISVISQLDQGSVFHCEIPFQKAVMVATPPLADDQTGHMLQKNQTGLSILLADDVEENNLVIQAFLKNTSHQLTCTNNGRDAVEYFKNGEFDLVLMDIYMPIMDGYQATQEIRAWEHQQKRPPTPILALTANVMKNDIEKTLQAGCNLHLSKPIRKQRLLEVLNQYLVVS